MTAPTPQVRRAVRSRDGEQCVSCGTPNGLTFQHRRAVGMGGSRNTPPPTDGLLACILCNEAYEHHMQTVALAYGWKVKKWADPTKVPVYYPHEHAWYVLEGTTRRPVTGVVALDLMHSVYGDQYMTWYAEANT